MPNARDRAHGEAYLALVALALIWSYTWVLIKVASADASPLIVAAVRPAIGAVILFGVLAATRRSLRPTPWRQTVVFGLLQTAGWTALQTFAVILGGAGKAALLGYTMPFWIVLLAWSALGERLTPARWFALALAALGLGFILTPFARGALVADLLGIGAGLSWGGATVWSKRLQRDDPSFDILRLTTWQMVWGSLPLVAIAAAFPEHVRWTLSFVGSMTFVVIFSQALGWVLWLFIVARLPAGVAGIASLATPVLVVAMAALQLHEVPSVHELIGMALILVALVVNALPSLRPTVRGEALRV